MDDNSNLNIENISFDGTYFNHDEADVVQDSTNDDDCCFPIKKLKQCFDDIVEAKNESENSDEHLKVFVRIRPIPSYKGESTIQILSDCVIKTTAPQNSKRAQLTRIEERKYTFAQVFGPQQSQQDVFMGTMTPLIDKFLRGESCVYFAYGITNAGKTHTIQGSNSEPGLLVLLINSLLERKPEDAEITFSMLEIYQEKVYDLLNKKNQVAIRDTNKKVEVANLSCHPITSEKDANKLIAKGASKRTNSRTLLNSGSSRSHVIYSIHWGNQAFQIIDLAGAERGNRTKANTHQQKEANTINLSLMILWRCLDAIKKKSTGDNQVDVIPFRDSKLTHLLMPLMNRVGTSGVVMVACVNPQSADYDETMFILGNASMAREITTMSVGRSVNAVVMSDLPANHDKNNPTSKIHAAGKKRRNDSVVDSTTCPMNDGIRSKQEVSEATMKLLVEKIQSLESENSLLITKALQRESVIRLEVSEEMAARSNQLLDQIKQLQNELFCLKNGQQDITQSVKKARKAQKLILRDKSFNDFIEIGEELESQKQSLEDQVLLLRQQLFDKTNECEIWKQKAMECSLQVSRLTNKLLALQRTGCEDNEIDPSTYLKEEKHEPTSPELKQPLKEKSPNVSSEGSVISSSSIEKVKYTKKFEGRISPTPFSPGDGSPIAPPQQQTISGANIFYARTLRSHNMRTLNIY